MSPLCILIQHNDKKEEFNLMIIAAINRKLESIDLTKIVKK